MRNGRLGSIAVGLADRADHVLATAHGGLDLAMSVRAARDMDGRAVVLLQGAVDELLATLATGHASDAHSALRALVDRHFQLPSLSLVCGSGLHVEPGTGVSVLSRDGEQRASYYVFGVHGNGAWNRVAKPRHGEPLLRLSTSRSLV